MSKWCVAYDGPYNDILYRYFKSKEEAEKFTESVKDKDPNVYEVSSNLKIFSRLKITSESLFIGHKLALEDLKKKAKDERYALGIIRNLQDNSDIGQFGSYSKDFPEALVYYWYIGGKKLTPTINEINDYIAKYWNNVYKTFKDLPSSLKYYFKK